jgi:hypothetical protein
MLLAEISVIENRPYVSVMTGMINTHFAGCPRDQGVKRRITNPM